MRVFKTIRAKMFKENKFSKYLLYAIGEIFLVVIGILIAVQINKWREEEKINNELSAILTNVQSDLAIDTLAVSQWIRFYENKKNNSQKIIDRELNTDNFESCPNCSSIITQTPPMIVNTKGYNLLKNFLIEHNNEKDSLITILVPFYNAFVTNIEKSNQRMEKDALDNIDAFKNYDWFVDWTQGKVTEEMILYFTQSEDYRKRVAAHNILASQNHLPLLRSYQLNAKEVLRRIEKRFQKK